MPYFASHVLLFVTVPLIGCLGEITDDCSHGDCASINSAEEFAALQVHSRRVSVCDDEQWVMYLARTGNFDMAVEIDYGGSLTKMATVDTGNSWGLLMSSYPELVKANPSVRIVENKAGPWGRPSYLVEADIKIGGCLVRNAQFYAAQGEGVDNIGLDLFAPQNPFNSIGSPGSVLSIDFDSGVMTLGKSSDCNGPWLKPKPDSGHSLWAEDLMIEGQHVDWAVDAKGVKSEAGLDSGGGPVWMAWRNVDMASWGWNPPVQRVHCPHGQWYPVFPVSGVAFPNLYGFNHGKEHTYNCQCYIADFSLNVTDGDGQYQIRLDFDKNDVLKLGEKYGVENQFTLMACERSRILAGGVKNAANLGGVLFWKYTVVFDYSQKTMCINNAEYRKIGPD